jgi:hypothetical protein
MTKEREKGVIYRNKNDILLQSETVTMNSELSEKKSNIENFKRKISALINKQEINEINLKLNIDNNDDKNNEKISKIKQNIYGKKLDAISYINIKSAIEKIPKSGFLTILNIEKLKFSNLKSVHFLTKNSIFCILKIMKDEYLHWEVITEVRAYVYIYLDTYVCICVYIYIYVYLYTCNLHGRISAYLYIYIYTYAYNLV